MLLRTPVALLALQRSAGNTAAAVVAQRQSVPPATAPPVGARTGRPIADLEKEFRKLIASARGSGRNVAADNLENWLTGASNPKPVPLGWLRGFPVVTEAEEKNHRRFEDQLQKLARGMAPGATDSLTDHWDAKINAPMTVELFYASGVSQLTSNGSFTLVRTGGRVAITGTVEQRWFDPYNWNAGMGAFIPGHGYVSDDVGLDLKDAGRGHDYLLENRYTQTLTGTYTHRPWYLPNSVVWTWSGP